MSIVSVKNLKKRYLDGDRLVEVLHGLNLEINRGDFVSIQGASGAGKSTLLNILGALDNFDEGEVTINGVHLHETSRSKLHVFRREQLGFVFQYHYLLPEFTVLENVMMPLMILNKNRVDARQAAVEVLEKVGMGHRVDHYPAEISGGESQRVAVARALVHKPPLILADEPTGNLDGANTDRFIHVLNQLVETENLTVLVVTHEQDLARTAPRQLQMSGGHLEELEAQVRQLTHRPVTEARHASTRVTMKAKPASFFGRAFALVVDLLVSTIIIRYLFAWLLPAEADGPESPGFLYNYGWQLSVLVFYTLWASLSESLWGVTLGKLVMAYRVYTEEGRPTLARALVRNLVKLFASTLPMGLGFLAAMFNKERLCLHDRAAKTRVVVAGKPVVESH